MALVVLHIPSQQCIHRAYGKQNQKPGYGNGRYQLAKFTEDIRPPMKDENFHSAIKEATQAYSDRICEAVCLHIRDRLVSHNKEQDQPRSCKGDCRQTAVKTICLLPRSCHTSHERIHLATSITNCSLIVYKQVKNQISIRKFVDRTGMCSCIYGLANRNPQSYP